MKRLAAAAIVVLVGTAHAAPFREQLTRDEIHAASDAAVAALPKVDAAAVKQCEDRHKLDPQDPKPDELAAAARCFRGSGNLGLAIRLWQTLVQRHPATPQATEATRALGPAFEAAGRFDDAARWSSDYAKKYPREGDALERMTRAVCTWRQLGRVDEAERGFLYLRATWGAKRKLDADTLCDQVRPIVVPPKARPAPKPTPTP